MGSERTKRVREALFRGDKLTAENVEYLQQVRLFYDELLSSDLGPGDLTAKALGITEEPARARILAKESGIAAGIEEFHWLAGRERIHVTPRNADGGVMERGDVLLEMTGRRCDLLSHERVGLNLLQRMCGIATTTRRLQERVERRNPGTCVVATRKTPLGLLDKRAVHLGGGGTHRLGLWDAVLIKNNHLAPLADCEEKAAPLAIERAWAARRDAAFIEVEVRSKESAIAAARAFCKLKAQEPEACPCLLLLDNRSPREAGAIVEALRTENLLEHMLIEASGNVSEANAEEYAAAGVDAISLGALTHSSRALDLSQEMVQGSTHEHVSQLIRKDHSHLNNLER